MPPTPPPTSGPTYATYPAPDDASNTSANLRPYLCAMHNNSRTKSVERTDHHGTRARALHENGLRDAGYDIGSSFQYSDKVKRCSSWLHKVQRWPSDIC